MYLTLSDLAFLFPEARGAAENFNFYTVTDDSGSLQPKGVFIRLNKDSGELLEAITNGAAAAIWDKGCELPRYTPASFPVFYTDEPHEAALRLVEYYIEKLDGETETTMTNFIFSNKKLLIKCNETYDIAGILKNFRQECGISKSEGRE